MSALDRKTGRTYVQKQQGYGVTAEGELWRLGPDGYQAGYISDPQDPGAMASGIDAHEEEVRIMMAAEFGL